MQCPCILRALQCQLGKRYDANLQCCTSALYRHIFQASATKATITINASRTSHQLSFLLRGIRVSVELSAPSVKEPKSLSSRYIRIGV
jgi:hypothetical protein